MVDPVFKKLVSYVLIASVFITGSSFIESPFSVFWFLPVYVGFLLYATIAYGQINLNILFAILTLSVYSLVTMKSNSELIVKQLINIIFTVLVFYNFIVHEDFNLKEVFRKYIQFSKLILIIGFVQVALFAGGLREVYLSVFGFLMHTNISERFQSLSDEPSLIALTFIPIVFLALHNLFYNSRYFIGRAWSVLFILGYVLTLSSAAFLALILMAFLLYQKKITIAKAALAMAFCFLVLALGVISYNQVDQIRTRVDDTVFALRNNLTDPAVYESVNLSTYALLSNAYVTLQTVNDFPFTGRGLGTHEISYDLYLPNAMREYSQLNRKDANSMGLRLLSETGILGTCTFLAFLVAFKVRRRSSDIAPGCEILWILNTSIFVVMLVALMRHGNYTSSGKMLFIILYYYSYRFYFSKRPFTSPALDVQTAGKPGKSYHKDL